MSVNRYNLRVYGLLFRKDEVLVTHENRFDILMTKFPGGGLEFGEGLEDGLIREFKEELDIVIEVGALYYVNEFLQISSFKESDQLISFYYEVSTKEYDKIKHQEFSSNIKDGEQLFEWRSRTHLNPEDFTFPIDKHVAKKLA